MPSGGARVRSGPNRDPNANRRLRPGDRSGFVHLPAAGREGDPPPWPLPGRTSKFERDRWAIEWAKPVAIMWDRLGMELQVAFYIRTLSRALSPKASGTVIAKVQSQEDRLGLSEDGRKKNGWIIDEGPQAAVPRRAPTSDAKDRLALIQGGADGKAS